MNGNAYITIGLSAPALIAVPVQGTDSCVAQFESGTCVYAADLGGFSDPLGNM